MAFTDSPIHYDLLLKMNIYLEFKKVKAWNMTVWNIMVEGYPNFEIKWNNSSKFLFTRKRS